MSPGMTGTNRHRMASMSAWFGSVVVFSALVSVLLIVARASTPEAPHRSPRVTAPDRSGPSPTTGSARKGPGRAGRRLVFRDDFDGNRLDPSKWIGCFPWAPLGCTNPPNHELDWYTPSQLKVSNGVLHVTADDRPIWGKDANGNPRRYGYRSGNATTAKRFSFTYGYVQFEARLPVGKGLWPAVWMLPTTQRPAPEIDILEANNRVQGEVFHIFHGHAGDGIGMLPAASELGIHGWHTYGLDWKPGSLTFYLDGVKRLVVTQAVPDQPMYLLATLAVGGDFPGPPPPSTKFPVSLDVRRLRVWQ